MPTKGLHPGLCRPALARAALPSPDPLYCESTFVHLPKLFSKVQFKCQASLRNPPSSLRRQ